LLVVVLASTSFAAEPPGRDAGAAGRGKRSGPPSGQKSEESDKPANPEKPDRPDKPAADKLSVTEHQFSINGQPLKYKATAGTLVLKDDSGKAKADVFFIAYEKLPADENPANRPVTFVFNGGPGAAAVWLHLGAVGPKRVKLTEDGDVPPPPGGLVDNEYTWLDATDLVFIDPVGTGYSRPAQGEKQEQFSGVREDVQWVGEFIRLYTTRYNRWASPKFLAGESYGTTRAASLSESLLEDQGIALNGIVFISTVLNFQTLSPSQGNELPYALYLPSYAAVAWYHKKLLPELQADLSKTLKEVEQFTVQQYIPALTRGAALAGDERSTLVQKLAKSTGLAATTVDKADLRIDPNLFRAALLADDRKELGRFDGRMTGYNSDPLSRQPDFDPSLSPYFAEYTAGFNQYIRQSLKYESDLHYEVLTGRVQPWNFGRAGNGYLDVSGSLQDAMRKNPHMSIHFASGLFDLATPYFATNYTVDHLDLPPELRSNVGQTYYKGGHMLYHYRPSLQKLHEDVSAFIKKATPAVGE
jgi:carboxypeptidase C (cathepsin A)